MLATLLFSLAIRQTGLDAILDSPLLAGANVSAIVTTTAGETVYERNPAAHMIPGSNQKLVSNTFALYALGPDYRTVTRFWKTPKGLFIDAPGNPFLSISQLEIVRDALKTRKSKPVFIREAYRVPVPPSWEYDDLPNRYAPEITALTLDKGGFELWAEKGKPFFLPRNYGVKIKTRPGPKLKTIYDRIKKQMMVEGPIPAARQRLDTLAIPAPDIQAAQIFGSKINYTDIVPIQAPGQTIESKPVSEILPLCLVPSDNCLAENLFLMAAAKGQPSLEDPYVAAQMAAKTFLTKVVGTETDDFRIVDGSGMSRHNLVTTRGLAKLLLWAHNQPTSALWHSSLVRPGKGTLAGRLEGLQFEGKTGTLDMVVALSGYVVNLKGETLVVSVILNNYLCPASEARKIADEFIRTVANSPASGTVLASDTAHEVRHSDPKPRPVDGNRLYRLGRNRHPSRQRNDRRAQPRHAGLH